MKTSKKSFDPFTVGAFEIKVESLCCKNIIGWEGCFTERCLISHIDDL